MLQAIRERAKAFIWVILILIAVPLAFLGLGNYFDSGKETPVVIVGDKEYFQRDVNRVYQQNAQNPMQFFQFSEEEMQQQALEQLVNNEVIAQVASELDLVVSDSTVRDFNKSLSYFQTDGKFDKKKYQNLIASQGETAVGFAEKVRKTLVMGQYRSGIMNSDFATLSDVNRILELKNQERDIEYVVVPVSNVETHIDDTMVSNYFQAHQDQFQNPERVSVEYIELNLEDLAEDVLVSEEELRDLYESNKDLYSTPERRKVSHILISLDKKANQEVIKVAQEKAQAIKERIIAGDDFSVLAKELSDDTVSSKNGGDLGLITPGIMEKNFEEVAFSLGKGELSDPVKTAFGFHLIKVTELKPGETKLYEQVRDELSKNFKHDKAENKFYELGERLAEVSYEDSGSLEPAAQTLNMEIKQTDLFTREKGDGIASESKIRDMAFNLEVLGGNNSEPVEIGDDKVVILRVKEHRLPITVPLDEVKDKIIATLKLDAAKERALERANEIMSKLENGVALKDILSQDSGLELKIKRISRLEKDFPSEITRAVFKAAKPVNGQPTPLLVALDNGEQAIINVLLVQSAETNKILEKDRDTVKNVLAQGSGVSLFSALVSNGRDKVGVKFFTSEE